MSRKGKQCALDFPVSPHIRPHLPLAPALPAKARCLAMCALPHTSNSTPPLTNLPCLNTQSSPGPAPRRPPRPGQAAGRMRRAPRCAARRNTRRHRPLR